MHQIKLATVDDIPLIRQLCLAVWPQTYASIISKQQIDYMLEMMYSPSSLQKQMVHDGCTFIIVYDDEVPVGFASYNLIAPQVWKLNKIYIVTTQQGKGTGKFAINYIIHTIKKQNAKALQLQVNKHNNAKFFYQKLGFKIIKDFVFDIGNGFVMDDYEMELLL